MTTVDSTEWRPVAGHKGSYAADRLGNVHSLSRRVRCCPRGVEGAVGDTRFVAGRIRKPKRRYEGDRWRIRLSRDNIQTDHDLAAIVLTAWAGPAASPNHVARQRDNDVDNNAPAHLYWAPRNQHEAREAA